jgi:hypothetical protein
MSSHAPYKVHIDQGAESDNKLCNVRAPIFYASAHKRQIARSVELYFAEIVAFSYDNNSSLGTLHGTKPWIANCADKISSRLFNLISINRVVPNTLLYFCEILQHNTADMSKNVNTRQLVFLVCTANDFIVCSRLTHRMQTACGRAKSHKTRITGEISLRPSL